MRKYLLYHRNQQHTKHGIVGVPLDIGMFKTTAQWEAIIERWSLWPANYLVAELEPDLVTLTTVGALVGLLRQGRLSRN